MQIQKQEQLQQVANGENFVAKTVHMVNIQLGHTEAYQSMAVL